MKEVMAVIRMEMINKTKDALLQEGFSSMNCRKVLGRGRKKVDYALVEGLFDENLAQEAPRMAEAISEGHRLVPKRILSLVVHDEEVQKVVKTLMAVNSKGKQGDGKIFVLPIKDAIRVRTGESGLDAL